MIVDDTGFCVLNVDVIAQVNDTAIGYDIKKHAGGFYRQHQGAKRHLIQGVMGDALLEDHLRVQRAFPGQDYLSWLHPEGGGDALQARQGTFLIGNIPSALCELHSSLGHQFNDLRLLIGVGLAAFNGKNNGGFHLCASRASFSNASISWE